MVNSIKIYQEVGDEIGSISYIDSMGTDLTIINSARVSFGVEKDTLNEKDIKLVRYLLKNKHTSTLEHNVITFKFVVPLFVRSQHHRHRTWSYNEISRRYTKEDLRFYEPLNLRSQHDSNRQASKEDTINPIVSSVQGSTLNWSTRAVDLIRDHSLQSLRKYELLLNSGVAKEQARMILPQNLYTEYYGSVNLNNLLKFYELRSHEGAQWEIQKVAQGCLMIAETIWPKVIGIYKEIRGVA